MDVAAIAARTFGRDPVTYRRERRGQLALIRNQRESLRLGLNRGFEYQYIETIRQARRYLAALRAVRHAGRVYAAAVAADAAYTLELERTYGREACNARYDARGEATPTLARLAAAKIAADEARRAAMRGENLITQ